MIEYATDEITNMVLDFCDCDDGTGVPHRARISGVHRWSCPVFKVGRLLNLALAEQQERIALALRQAWCDPETPFSSLSDAVGAARIARETP